MTPELAILGAGYVGLPLAQVFAEAGVRTVLVEVDAGRVEQIGRGESYIEDVPGEALAPLVASGALLGISWNALRPKGAIALGGPPAGVSQERSCAAPTAGVAWIDPEAARALLESSTDVAFVDARSRADFNAAHVVGAVSMPVDDGPLADGRVVDFLHGARTVIAYCDTTSSCARSTRLAERLLGSGLHDVRVLRGGFPTWLDRSYPAESGVCRFCPTP